MSKMSNFVDKSSKNSRKRILALCFDQEYQENTSFSVVKRKFQFDKKVKFQKTIFCSPNLIKLLKVYP